MLEGELRSAFHSRDWRKKQAEMFNNSDTREWIWAQQKCDALEDALEALRLFK